MAARKIYNWTRYSIAVDGYPVSPQRGTREAIEKKGLLVVDASEEEVDESLLDEEGFLK